MMLFPIMAAARPTALIVSEPRRSSSDVRSPAMRCTSSAIRPRELDEPLAMIALTVAETEALGRRLAPELAAGDVVLVEGELGAGKTTFVRGGRPRAGRDRAGDKPH